MLKPIVATVLTAMVFACVQPSGSVPAPPDSAGPPPGGQGSTQNQEWAAIVRLENEAKAIAKTTGCSNIAQCKAAPVGNRACGGPRYYVAYCAQNTDSAALFRKLDEVVRAENAYNRKYDLVSTCEFRMPPELTMSGGECRAATP